ncbi:hypothetical protein BC830DRAFT_372807 [Chytriomyces sp. MP71]|nr:hypothetical protein BC830DRAFT_372807 [Chytriomyces sp. MP71]
MDRYGLLFQLIEMEAPLIAYCLGLYAVFLLVVHRLTSKMNANIAVIQHCRQLGTPFFSLAVLSLVVVFFILEMLTVLHPKPPDIEDKLLESQSRLIQSRQELSATQYEIDTLEREITFLRAELNALETRILNTFSKNTHTDRPPKPAAPRLEGIVAWTDLIRAVDPTFMALPGASHKFSEFAVAKHLPKVYVPARIGVKGKKVTARRYGGVHVKWRGELLRFMEGHYVQPRARGIVYNRLIQALMPAYKHLDKQTRIDIKRGVRDFLMFALPSTTFKLQDCIVPADDAHVETFAIPKELVPEFREWAHAELVRCFPDRVVF